MVLLRPLEMLTSSHSSYLEADSGQLVSRDAEIHTAHYKVLSHPLSHLMPSHVEWD